MSPIFEVSGLRVGDVVGPVDFSLEPGERLGILGASGSGKSLTALALLGLAPLPVSGSARLSGRELVGLPDRRARRLRGRRIAMVFQEPMSALDPLMTIGGQLSEALARRDDSLPDKGVEEALAEVGLPAEAAGRYPFALSGGQRQRVLLAMALAAEPDVLHADEPTTALDAVVEDEIVDLLVRLTKERGAALVLISHDVSVVRRACPTALVVDGGRVVERGETERLLADPGHPATERLAAALDPVEPAAARPHGEPVASLSGVSRSFGGRAALSGVDLEVRRGERLGIVGAPGSGKTTLLRLLSGLDRPDVGEVSVAGRAQLVFQDPAGSLDPRWRLWRSVAEPLTGPRRERRKTAERLLARVGLEGRGDDRPGSLSGGQRQRAAIARALAGEPDLLLADEAVSALDLAVRGQILGLLDEAAGVRRGLVFVSHDIAAVRALCDTIAVVRGGEIVERGATAEVCANPGSEYTRRLLQAAAPGPRR